MYVLDPGGLSVAGVFCRNCCRWTTGKLKTVTEVPVALAKEVGETAQNQYDSMLTAIRRNPIQAAGIAAGVGFILGLIAR